MSPLSDKTIASPDRRYEARLAPAAGSSWDLSHASLALHGLSFEDRIFGWNGVWSSCSRYFAITEWTNLDQAHCPGMQLVVIDVHSRRECVVEHVACGFIEPMYFHEEAIKYNLIAKGMEERTVAHRGIAGFDAWRTVPASGSGGALRGRG